MRFKILLFLLCVLFGDPKGSLSAARNNVTNLLEDMGIPHLGYYQDDSKLYARNVWDMIGYRGKLYFGAGNSSNYGPSVGPRRAPIFAYDPQTGAFEIALITDEEQIDTFYLSDDILCVPGHDPKESWSLGNIYMTEDGVNWDKKRTIPNGIHTYALYSYQDKMFAALGTSKMASVAISENLGESWNISAIATDAYRAGTRFYNFLHVGERLYVTGAFLEEKLNNRLKEQKGIQKEELFEFTEVAGFIHRNEISSKIVFPDTYIEENSAAKITRPQSFKNKSIYIGGYIHNDHQAIPFGLYTAHSLKINEIDIRKVSLPEKAIPWDIYRTDEYIYVLVNTVGEAIEETAVLRSNNLEDWEELFYFEPPGLVRSFAFENGIFYFSIGSEFANARIWPLGDLDSETGTLFKLQYSSNLAHE